jgi:GT2 family glycosyltransferase
MEFCWRARLAGFTVGIAAASVCRHQYDFRDRLRMLFYFQRNRLLTLLTLERLGTILLTLPCLLVSELAVGLYFAAQGRGREVWALVRHFLRRQTWAVIAARRREVRRLRSRTDAEIVGRFAGRVVFAEINGPAMRYLLNPLLACYWAVARRLIVW